MKLHSIDVADAMDIALSTSKATENAHAQALVDDVIDSIDGAIAMLDILLDTEGNRQ